MTRHLFKGEIEGYATNYFHKNLWRLHGTHELGDAMQEAWFVFNKCDERYPDVEPKHFMALFKTSLERRVVNLSKISTRVRESECHMTPELAELPKFEPIGETDNAGYLKRLCSQAPTEVKQVLSLFLSAPTELLESAMDAWSVTGRRDAGGNEHVSRLLGLPQGSKPLDNVAEFFTA